MSKNESIPEFAPETVDSDDVEILEVVGVEEGSDPSAHAAESEPTLQPEAAEDEYLLDFDDPEHDPLAKGNRSAAPDTAPDGGNGDAADSDHDRLLRLRADYANLRRRIERERDEFELRANCDLVEQLLPVVDNLERALSANSAAGDEGPLREGLVMIYRQLTGQLREAGLEPIESVGQVFDPNLHDAVATEPSTEVPANTIVDEMQKGYLFQDKVLRPAMVRVSTGNRNSGEDA